MLAAPLQAGGEYRVSREPSVARRVPYQKVERHETSMCRNMMDALKAGDAAAVRYLLQQELDAGADFTRRDAAGRSALDYARANGFTRSAALLEAATKK